VLKAHYRRFLEARPERLHFAAHSHHAWPDVTREAVVQYWDDAARLADRKWEHVFGEVVPRVQDHLARLMGTGQPRQIAFAANTHDFVVRLLSCFEEGRPLGVLTTDSEFYSFARQAARLEEGPRVRITRVAVEPFATFDARFAEAAAGEAFDLVYLSHVFFNSGFVVADLAALVGAVGSREAMVVVDGYHSVGALPLALQPLEERFFYVGGGYKYLQVGEGFGFLHVPRAARCGRPPPAGSRSSARSPPSPRRASTIPTTPSASGAPPGTPPPPTVSTRSWDLWQREGVTPEKVHAHAQKLQRRLLEALERSRPSALDPASLATPRDLVRQGNFLTFRFDGAPALHEALRARSVETDLRGDRIRFGFGPYQDEGDVDALVERLKAV
jgi:selenocysteine lyase/cysteine desulfurase